MSRSLPQASRFRGGGADRARLACCSLPWAGHTQGLRPTQQLPMIMRFAHVSEACWAWPLAIPSLGAVSLINNLPRTGNRLQAEEPYRYFEPVERQVISLLPLSCVFASSAPPTELKTIHTHPNQNESYSLSLFNLWSKPPIW